MNRLEAFIQKEFDTSNFKVIKEFPVLYAGWESDYEACIVEVNGKTVVIGTNHGSPYVMKRYELSGKCKEYTEALAATVEALSVMD